MMVSGERHTLAALPPGERERERETARIVKDAEWSTETAWMGAENLPLVLQRIGTAITLSQRTK